MERLRVGSDQLEVELLPELGGRMHRLRAFGHDLLRTPADLAAYRRDPFFWGSFVMAPWCNRIAAEPQEVAGTVVDVPANFPDGSAIHGQVLAREWDVVGPATLRVAAGGDGWPWRYDVTQRLEVDGARLRLSVEVTNQADAAMPAGIGIHPWLLRPLEIAIAGDEVYPSNLDAGADPEPVAGRLDRRAGGLIPPDLDATWVSARPDPIRLRWPTPGVNALIRVSPSARYVCAASPAGLDAVAVEPQTHAPGGLRRLAEGRTGGLAWLPPRESLLLEVEFAFSRP